MIIIGFIIVCIIIVVIYLKTKDDECDITTHVEIDGECVERVNCGNFQGDITLNTCSETECIDEYGLDVDTDPATCVSCGNYKKDGNGTCDWNTCKYGAGMLNGVCTLCGNFLTTEDKICDWTQCKDDTLELVDGVCQSIDTSGGGGPTCTDSRIVISDGVCTEVCTGDLIYNNGTCESPAVLPDQQDDYDDIVATTGYSFATLREAWEHIQTLPNTLNTKAEAQALAFSNNPAAAEALAAWLTYDLLKSNFPDYWDAAYYYNGIVYLFADFRLFKKDAGTNSIYFWGDFTSWGLPPDLDAALYNKADGKFVYMKNNQWWDRSPGGSAPQVGGTQSGDYKGININGATGALYVPFNNKVIVYFGTNYATSDDTTQRDSGFDGGIESAFFANGEFYFINGLTIQRIVQGSGGEISETFTPGENTEWAVDCNGYTTNDDGTCEYTCPSGSMPNNNGNGCITLDCGNFATEGDSCSTTTCKDEHFMPTSGEYEGQCIKNCYNFVRTDADTCLAGYCQSGYMLNNAGTACITLDCGSYEVNPWNNGCRDTCASDAELDSSDECTDVHRLMDSKSSTTGQTYRLYNPENTNDTDATDCGYCEGQNLSMKCQDSGGANNDHSQYVFKYAGSDQIFTMYNVSQGITNGHCLVEGTDTQHIDCTGHSASEATEFQFVPVSSSSYNYDAYYMKKKSTGKWCRGKSDGEVLCDQSNTSDNVQMKFEVLPDWYTDSRGTC